MTYAALIFAFFFAFLSGAFSMSALIWLHLGFGWRNEAFAAFIAAAAALLMVAL